MTLNLFEICSEIKLLNNQTAMEWVKGKSGVCPKTKNPWLFFIWHPPFLKDCKGRKWNALFKISLGSFSLEDKCSMLVVWNQQVKRDFNERDRTSLKIIMIPIWIPIPMNLLSSLFLSMKCFDTFWIRTMNSYSFHKLVKII